MSLSPSLPDFAQRALAALQAGKTVATPSATAYRLGDCQTDRPYAVMRNVGGRVTVHATPALAVACLASL